MALRWKKAQCSPAVEGGLTDASRSYCLLQVSDLHLLPDPSARLLGVDTAASFDAVLAHATRILPSVDAVIVTGDIAHEPTISTYQRAQSILWRYHRGPSLWLPGNHDVSSAMAAVLPVERELVLGPWHVVTIDTHIDETEQGHIGKDESRRVRAVIDGSVSEHVIVAGHHPCVSVDTPWLDRGCIDNADVLLELLASAPRISAYVFGHIHHAAQFDGARCPMLAAPSTCFQFAQGGARFGVTHDAPGCRALTLHAGGRLESQVLRADYALNVDLTQFR